MKYQIGLVAKLLDLSPEGLRLYERAGILSPQREETSGYRYYERLDITSLLRARSYQKYGFSLQEIKQLLNTDDMNYLQEQYELQEENLQKEILLKQLEIKRLHYVKDMIQSFPDSLWKIEEEIRPAMYRLNFMKDNELLLEKNQYSLFQEWSALAPLAFSSLRNEYQAMLKGQDICYSGIAIREEDVKALQIEPLVLKGEYISPCLSLSTIVEVRGEDNSCVDYLSHVLKYIQQNNYKIIGDAISESIISMNKQNDYTRYRKIWIPIEK